MSIFSRYVFRQTASALLLIMSSLSGIVWIALALRQLKVVTASGEDAFTLIAMTTLALPNLFGFIGPIALLIATLHVLNRLNGDSELIILTASGATVWHVARPLMLLAAMVAAGVALVNFYAMPASLKKVRGMIVDMRSNLIGQALQEGKFTRPEDNVVIHMRERRLNGELRGILFHDGRNSREITSLMADRGRVVTANGQVFLEMFDGHIVRQTEPVGPAQVITFQRYALDLDTFKRQAGPINYKVRERFLGELINVDPQDPRFKSDPGQFRAEIHERFSSCLYPFAFILIALAYMGQAQSTRTNRGNALMMGFAAAAALRLGGLALNKVVVQSAAAVPLLYLLPLAGMAAGAYAIYRNERPVPTPAWRRKLSNQIDDAMAAAKRRLVFGIARQQQPGE